MGTEIVFDCLNYTKTRQDSNITYRAIYIPLDRENNVRL